MILVTGANGFVGRHLVRYLSGLGAEVRALFHRREPDAEMRHLPGVQWMQCDLLDVFAVEEAVKGVDEIYHCAAVVSFHPKRREEMMQANISGTAHLVDEALNRQIRKMVFISSVAALGRNNLAHEITEEEQWEEGRSASAYGQSKYLAEMEVWRGIGEGMNAVIVNPGIVLGAGDWSDGSTRLMKLAYDEFPFYTTGVNGWVDVQDLVTAVHRLMDSDITSERFILSAGNFSYREVFTLMAGALNRRPPRVQAPAFLTGLVWRWSMLKSRITGSTVTITRETAGTARNICRYNNDKLKQALPGFSYAPIEETIGRMAAAYLLDHRQDSPAILKA